jgi:methylene-tetrahydromethanopterin dehydrogenase
MSGMERPYVLHLFTPGAQASPFDVNMAADAGYQLIVPYCQVALDGVAALTQDAIFSRGPKGVRRTGIFIGGRDAVLAADMLERARQALVPPFAVSLFADPSGAYTTAAALVACAEAALRERAGGDLKGRRVLLLGGTGPVGRIAAVLFSKAGATAVLGSRHGLDAADAAAHETGKRFDSVLASASTRTRAELREALAAADVVVGVAAAGVQVMDAEDRASASRMRVAVDVNAVPPAGLAGVGPMDDRRPIDGTQAVGIGALAVGNVKYQVQNRLLTRMRESDRPECFGFEQAFEVARELLAAKAPPAASPSP